MEPTPTLTPEDFARLAQENQDLTEEIYSCLYTTGQLAVLIDLLVDHTAVDPAKVKTLSESITKEAVFKKLNWPYTAEDAQAEAEQKGDAEAYAPACTFNSCVVG